MKRATQAVGVLVLAGFLAGCNAESSVNPSETKPATAVEAAAKMPPPMPAKPAKAVRRVRR